jgi:hypothetical protein
LTGIPGDQRISFKGLALHRFADRANVFFVETETCGHVFVAPADQVSARIRLRRALKHRGPYGHDVTHRDIA